MDNELIEIKEVLRTAKTIAVLGFSNNPNKTSRQIADYLVNKGYKVLGVNPNIGRKNIAGTEVFASLLDINESIDIVDVFRRSEDIPQIIPDVLTVKPKVLWLQQGIFNDIAVKPVADLGIKVYQDKCIAVYYSLCSTI